MIYDLIVLGGGPGGYLAAERAGAAGLSVLLIEKKALGGVCLNEGCIPTKTLLHSAKLLEGCKNGAQYGVTCENPALLHPQVIARKDKVVRKLVAGVRAALRENGVEVVTAEGELRGKTSDGFVLAAGDAGYTGRNLIIATGSEPCRPALPGLAEAIKAGTACHAAGLLSRKELPGRLVIIGGGVIGLEMAYYFSAAGSQVTVLELQNKIAGCLDGELSVLLQKNLGRQGVSFRLGTEVSAVDGGKVLAIKDGLSEEHSFDTLLSCVGRRAVTQGFGLETLGVLVEPSGITVDECCRTNVPRVYAVGDCNGQSLLAHSAYRQAEVAVNTILNRADAMSYRAIPSVIYTHPEAAWTGLTGEEAGNRGITAETVTLSMNYSGRYAAENERGDGVCKLVFDKARKTLIGAHILGGPASEFIVTCGMLIESELPLEQMRRFVFPHPTVSEIIREALFQAAL